MAIDRFVDFGKVMSSEPWSEDFFDRCRRTRMLIERVFFLSANGIGFLFSADLFPLSDPVLCTGSEAGS